MRGTRHQNPSVPAKPGSSSPGLPVTGLRRNDTGSDRAGAAGPTPPATKETDDASDWPSAGGIPVVLLWLPYTALTALLLGLMLASFIRFHRKRLRKFRSRKDQLWRQLDVQEFLQEQRRELLPPNGNLLPPAAAILPPATSQAVDDDRQNRRQMAGNGRRNTPLEALHAHSDREVSLACRPDTRQVSPASRSSSRQVARGEHRRTSDETRRKRSSTTTVPEVTRRDRPPHVRRAAAGTGNAARKRNSVVFITNINGSMVNLRCGEPDALDPFQGRRCFWAVGERRPSTACPPIRTLVEPPCLRHPVARPAIWTTAFSYDPDMEYECRKTRYYD